MLFRILSFFGVSSFVFLYFVSITFGKSFNNSIHKNEEKVFYELNIKKNVCDSIPPINRIYTDLYAENLIMSTKIESAPKKQMNSFSKNEFIDLFASVKENKKEEYNINQKEQEHVAIRSENTVMNKVTKEKKEKNEEYNVLEEEFIDSFDSNATGLKEEIELEFTDSFDSAEKDALDTFEDDFDNKPKESKPMYSMNEDIFEDFNRSVYNFNSVFYQVAIAPVAKTYSLITTEELREGISNVLDNLQAPLRIILNILQGKFQNAGIEFSRFIVNTTIGLLGFVDITARDTPPSYTIETINTTLAAWKIPSGPFIMLPFLGPSTIRRTASYIIGSATNPIKLLWPSSTIPSLLTPLEIVNNSPFYLDIFYKVEDTSFEPYTATRALFLQIESTPRKL